MKSRTALVTGGTGFVGSHLVDLLLDRGYRVYCAVRRSSRLRWLEGKKAELISVDFGRPLELPPVDLLFHVAGVVSAESLEGYRRGNVLTTRRVAEAAKCGRFLHVSSIAAVGPGDVDETAPPRPISLYGQSKLEGEREVLRHRDRIAITIVRPPAVYGERDEGLLDLYRTIDKGLRPRIGGTKWVSLVHVRDLVEGMLAAAEHPAGAGETFFLCDPHVYRMSDLVDEVARALGKRIAIPLPVPDRLVRFLGGISQEVSRWVGRPAMFNRDKALEMTQGRWVCSPAKAERLVGWRARVPLDSGLLETLRWYRNEGLLA